MDKIGKSKNVEFKKVILSPSMQMFLGIKVKKDTYLDEPEFITADGKGKIKQTIKDLKLTTKVTREYEVMGIKTVEKTVLTQELHEGTELVWGEEEGYVISPYKMATVPEVIESLEAIKDI